MEFSANQIAALLGGNVQGDGEVKLNNLGTIQDATQGYLTFLSNPKYEPFLYETKASAVIVSKEFTPRKEVSCTLIHVDNPYLAFTQLMEEVNKMLVQTKVGVEEPVYTGEEVTQGDGLYRGAFSYVGSRSQIGDQVKIYPQVYIGEDVTIGEGSILYPGVKVYSGTIIGKNCVLHAGAIIGSDGFGFAPQEDGSYRPIPQMGNVVLKDNVSIGANTVIDCATLQGSSTIIQEGVKLDNLIQVGHNVVVGEHTVIAAQTGISGSAQIGSYCMIGGQVGVAGHLQVGNHVKIDAQSGIAQKVPDKAVILGSPAIDRGQFIRASIVFRKLPELQRRIQELEEKTLNLPATEK